MNLVFESGGAVRFDRAAIMRLAFWLGRFALVGCATVAERNHQRSLWLKQAWARARAEAWDVKARAQREQERRAAMAREAAVSAAWAARFDHDPAVIATALERETMRDRMDFAAIARLEAALAASLAGAIPRH